MSGPLLPGSIPEDLPRGVVVIRGNDIGVVGAVTVEVDGTAVCVLAPMGVDRRMQQSGHATTQLALSEHALDVRWEGWS